MSWFSDALGYVQEGVAKQVGSDLAQAASQNAYQQQLAEQQQAQRLAEAQAATAMAQAKANAASQTPINWKQYAPYAVAAGGVIALVAIVGAMKKK